MSRPCVLRARATHSSLARNAGVHGRFVPNLRSTFSAAHGLEIGLLEGECWFAVEEEWGCTEVVGFSL